MVAGNPDVINKFSSLQSNKHYQEFLLSITNSKMIGIDQTHRNHLNAKKEAINTSVQRNKSSLLSQAWLENAGVM